MILKDILTTEEQHSDFISNLINFQKRQLSYREITTVQGYQQRPYNLQPVHQVRENILSIYLFPVIVLIICLYIYHDISYNQIATFLNNFPKKDEKELMELSLKYEPSTAGPANSPISNASNNSNSSNNNNNNNSNNTTPITSPTFPMKK